MLFREETSFEREEIIFKGRKKDLAIDGSEILDLPNIHPARSTVRGFCKKVQPPLAHRKGLCQRCHRWFA